MTETFFHLYRTPALTGYRKDVLRAAVRQRALSSLTEIETESCFNIFTSTPLTDGELQTLRWLLSETFEQEKFSGRSFLTTLPSSPREEAASVEYVHRLIEVGPRMNFTTTWSTNAVSICHACGLDKVLRIERSRRYRLSGPGLSDLAGEDLGLFLRLIHDRMTECLYAEPLRNFETGVKPAPVRTIPLIEKGTDALRELNQEMGLGFDDWDIGYYHNLFVKELGRNPTNVECFDLSQSNSEHSRHWFFRGRLIINGQEAPENLMQIVKGPYLQNPGNSVIAFNDNSSAIRGYTIRTILPESPGRPSPFRESEATYHVIFTAETHNFPSGVAPFPGAETGTGGRIRDVHATGRGGLVVAGTAAYCVGNLQIPRYPLPWEDSSFVYPGNLASPLQIEIEASNGASDYGNKFGEPVIQGFTRSFGLRLPGGVRREWIKPIMFTGGIGQIDGRHLEKGAPQPGMLVVKIGGPAFRIGIGGGSASSMIQGENVEELDFNAVQRGDAEMEQKVNRVIRACIELGDGNPIVSIHDQGAGGNCNVVKEIIHPAGARINVRRIILGDETLSVLEIWGAEYQEQDALLLRPRDLSMFSGLCEREKVPVAVIGEITGDGMAVLVDELDDSTPVNLSLARVLGEMPQKTFHLDRLPLETAPLSLPQNLRVREALDRVLRLLPVGSKRFLTNKVDRSVTGLIARQQCAGPLQLTVSDVAVIAQSHFGLTGGALSIGEQPVKGLINPAAMARMSVGEALTNIVWAKVTALEDIRCSANWMWAPKLPGEGARLYDAAVAMRDLMLELGIAVDGGKDSLSMAARVLHASGEREVVKSPGTLVISAYVTCPDVTRVITPDLKCPGESRLLLIDPAEGRARLGGSALAQCFSQIGDDCPDVNDPSLLKRAFRTVQELIARNLILSGHDRSDGGLITALLEMAFAGNCGMDISLGSRRPGVHGKVSPEFDVMAALFSEELGLVIEYLPGDEQPIVAALQDSGLPFALLGRTARDARITLTYGHDTVLDEDLRVLRDIWEETSHHIDMLQANPRCVTEEKEAIYDRPGPAYHLSFLPELTTAAQLRRAVKPAVAIIREEGSNGDREMTSAFYAAGVEPWDITMTDLLGGRIDLSRFRGVVFVGGFSYADVLDSAKGWAGVIRFNSRLDDQFRAFYDRPDTFSLGICNGCQLMALLGWVPWPGIAQEAQPRFIHNLSGRFESRFSTVTIFGSRSIMLKGMEGSTLGVWVAHGEGRAHFPDPQILGRVIDGNLAPVRYVDDRGKVTETYPFNPNGSPRGIAGLCSPDGRHLAMMPHPERAFLTWQWAWMPEQMKQTLEASPWLRMFQNARQWCEER